MAHSNREQRIATPEQLGDILRERRKSKGLSQTDLASKIGVSQARVSSIEVHPDTLTLDRLISLANLLDLEVVIRDRSHTAPETDW